MKYIIEFEDKPSMYEDEVYFYKCIQAPWWGLSERVIERLTPYEPERKNGHWLRYGEDGYPNNEDTVFWQCDQCLEQYTGRTNRIPNFCPNCGANMRKGK